MVSHSGFTDFGALITAFDDGTFFMHPDGQRGLAGTEANYSGNVITLRNHIYELYKYMSGKDCITPGPNGQAFDFDADVNKANMYFSRVLEHETTHSSAPTTLQPVLKRPFMVPQ